jgi:alpha-tubulin suppressor-like RCC1 family protein
MCWGSNFAGQLGTTQAGTVIIPRAVARGLRFSQVSGGYAASCALTPDGAAYCWGDNAKGTLGIGHTAGPEQCIYGPCSMSPVGVTGGLRFDAIGVGGGLFACAVESSGTLYCWGSNESGTLGIGSTTGPEICTGYAEEFPCSTSPVPVAGGLTFAALAMGADHACALTATGAAYCWGLNVRGQLGDGTTVDRSAPVPVLGGLTFVALGAGWAHTCGLTTQGTVYCWGFNESAALGIGTSTGPETCAPRPPHGTDPFACSTRPVAVSGAQSLTAISVGDDHACALTPAGVAYCWGWNGNGAVGDGTTTDRPSPVAVAGGLAFANLSAGGSHTCAVTRGGIAYCWGNNQSGALGTGTSSQEPTTTPVRVVGQP